MNQNDGIELRSAAHPWAPWYKRLWRWLVGPRDISQNALETVEIEIPSILSDREDGAGYFYGFREGDHRQINVCRVVGSEWLWHAYVGGEKIIGHYISKEQAEAAAIAWAEANPAEE